MDATSMLYQRHERGIHALSVSLGQAEQTAPGTPGRARGI
jgi:hypothetical protein